MKIIFRTFFPILLTGSIAFAVLLGLSLLIGWLITLILPFSLFEGTVLALLGIAIILFVGIFIINQGPFLPGENSEPFEFEDEEEYQTIPRKRFAKTDAAYTWEKHYQHGMANTIYEEFQDEPEALTGISAEQQQEIAVRLAEFGVAIVKTKSAKATRLSVSKVTLKKHMARMRQQPYADDILDTAVPGINAYIDSAYNDLVGSIEMRDWNEPAQT